MARKKTTWNNLNVMSRGIETSPESGILRGVLQINLEPKELVEGKLEGITFPFILEDGHAVIFPRGGFFYGKMEKLDANFRGNTPQNLLRDPYVVSANQNGETLYQVPVAHMTSLTNPGRKADRILDISNRPEVYFLNRGLRKLIRVEIGDMPKRDLSNSFSYFPEKLREEAVDRGYFFKGIPRDNIKDDNGFKAISVSSSKEFPDWAKLWVPQLTEDEEN